MASWPKFRNCCDSKRPYLFLLIVFFLLLLQALWYPQWRRNVPLNNGLWNTTTSKVVVNVHNVVDLQRIVQQVSIRNGTVPKAASSNGISVVQHTKPKPVVKKVEPVKNSDTNLYKDGKRPASCDSCFVHNFKYILNNDKVCTTQGGGGVSPVIDLLFVVTTIHSHVGQRDTLRKTWLTLTKNNTANFRYVFLLGNTDEEGLADDVERENLIYHDIVKEDFKDVYSNLTYKTIMGLKWALNYCKQARFVMKTDDDVWVNVKNIINFLNSSETNRRTNSNGNSSNAVVYGNCWKGKPIRSPNSKWYVSANIFSDKYYPTFCSGTGYAMSLETARIIYDVSAHVPYFHLEDVYIGICVKKVGGQTQAHKGFFYKGRVSSRDMCVYKSAAVMTGHSFKTDKLKQIWNLKCDDNKKYKPVR